ncbi:Choline transport protein [Fusarium oxysporum f. sp. albedinis]|nr:Choline transport protein [Fusarium oxysporum f. sp. albedinis]
MLIPLLRLNHNNSPTYSLYLNKAYILFKIYQSKLFQATRHITRFPILLTLYHIRDDIHAIRYRTLYCLIYTQTIYFTDCLLPCLVIEI